MQLSDTVKQTGLVQRVEYYTRRPYGSSGNELREIIHGLNLAFDRVIPFLLMKNDLIRWDDPKHTDKPVGTTNLVSGQADYKFTEDANTLDILNITNVSVLPSSTATDYVDLIKLTADDPLVTEVISPNSDNSGVPTHYLELGGKIFLYPEPNYSATNGVKIFFGREQARFTVTGTSGDDTTEPGIPKPFHDMLALYVSENWLGVNRPDDSSSIQIVRDRIQSMEKEFKSFINTSHPAKPKMTVKGRRDGNRPINFR